MHLSLLLLKKIPRGKVVSYSELAKKCRTSPRAIGTIMKNNKDPVGCPCYKVVKSSGDIGGYSGKNGIKGKIRLLKRDGIKIVDGKIDKGYFYRFQD